VGWKSCASSPSPAVVARAKGHDRFLARGGEGVASRLSGLVERKSGRPSRRQDRVRFGHFLLAPDRAGSGDQLLDGPFGDILGDLAVLSQDALAQRLAEFLPHERFLALIDLEVLRDERQLLAFVARHRVAISARPLPGDVAKGTDERFEQPRAEDRRAAPALDVVDEREPAVELARVVGESRRVPPDLPLLQAHEEHRNPPVAAIAHRAARRRHRAVDLAVALQFLKEHGHERRDRLHRDIPLHRDDRRECRPPPAADRAPRARLHPRCERRRQCPRFGTMRGRRAAAAV
jgi:hypothetical protein